LPPASNLDRLFSPTSIAVVGASNNPDKMGNLFIRRLASQFGGHLYAVNSNEPEIAGIPTCRAIADLPVGIDMMIALVPAAGLVALVESCKPNQCGFLLAIPSGFAEVSEQGSELQSHLAAAARSRGIRMLGPNIVGVMNGVLGLNASMMPELPPGGRGLSCLTQSGGFGMALSMYALDHHVQVAKFCDVGNMADVQLHEVLDYLADDDDTSVIGMFIESAMDGSAFLRSVERAASRKPVVFTAVGVTSAGRRASLTHLGMAAEMTDLVSALPSRVVCAETGTDLLNSARALMWQPKAQGHRVAILTGTGGIGAELADLSLHHGLEVPVLSAPSQDYLRQHLPYYAGVANPVDCTPIWRDYATIYPAVLEMLDRSGEVDLAIISITDVAATLPDLARAIAACARKLSISLIVFWGARHRDRDNMVLIEQAGVPCYPTTREAAQAAAALAGTARPGQAARR